MNENELRKDWTNIKEKIRDEYQITGVSYNTWIKNLELASIMDNIITINLRSDNPLMITYLNSRYCKPFRIILSDLLNTKVNVVFALSGNRQGEALG